MNTSSDRKGARQRAADRTCVREEAATVPATGETSDPGAGLGKGLMLIVLLALFSVGLYKGGFFERLQSRFDGSVDAYLRNAGIVLEKIVVTGQINLKDDQIVEALGIRTGQSLFGFDAQQAQKTLGKLGLVKSARVMRLLPSTLLVEIEERVPFARWLHDGQIELIDRQGVVLSRLNPEKHANYPLVAGDGAPEKADRLIRVLSSHEALAGELKMAELVAGRRWNLHAKSGAVIKLSADNLALGLARFVALPNWYKLLNKANMVVDLRLPDRAYLFEEKVAAKAIHRG